MYGQIRLNHRCHALAACSLVIVVVAAFLTCNIFLFIISGPCSPSSSSSAQFRILHFVQFDLNFFVCCRRLYAQRKQNSRNTK